MRIASMMFAGAAMAMSAPMAMAQPADDGAAAMAAQREAVGVLGWMNGRWRGQAVHRTAQGEHRVTQTERVGDLLGGTIKLIEGRGFEDDGRIGFNAFGVLSFDAATKRYRFSSHTRGRSGDFAFTATDKGYVWEIPAGPMTIRYTATLTDGTWTEIGERIAPGRPAMKFFEMTLKRVGEADWPEAGAMTPR